MRKEELGGAVGLSKIFLRRSVRAGDRVVDATCGRGRDTLFLAELVGSGGKVWAFDVQEEALTKTDALVRDAGYSGTVRLVRASHEHLARYVDAAVRAVVFNLGYLPGAKDGVVTRSDTTLTALDAARNLLLPGGVIVLAVYTAHPGGEEEAVRVEEWAGDLPPQQFNVWKSHQLNRSAAAPYVLVVEKSPLPGD